MTRFTALLIYCFCFQAVAGYRVYRLKVYTLNLDETEIVRTQEVLSNLDANQYGSYYRYANPIRVRMLDTWFCPGDTSHFREYCEKPEPQAERAPSSFNAPKRPGLPRNYQPVIP